MVIRAHAARKEAALEERKEIEISQFQTLSHTEQHRIQQERFLTVCKP